MDFLISNINPLNYFSGPIGEPGHCDVRVIKSVNLDDEAKQIVSIISDHVISRDIKAQA